MIASTAVRAAIVAVALVLTWRVAQVNVVAYDERGHPRLPTGADTGSSDLALLKRILHDNPGQVDALLLIAGEHERSGNVRETRRAHDAAFRLAPNDREVLGAGADFALRHGASADALAMLDRLVDAYPDSRQRAFPAIARSLAGGRDAAAWSAIVARRPEWLGPFVAESCEQGVDPGLLVPLLLDRVATGRAAPSESGCVIDRLRDRDRWDEAYHVWLNTLPRERMANVGNVFNGSFEFAPSAQGFDWRPTPAREQEAGHAVEIAPAAEAQGKRALRVSYNGKRQVGVPIAQYTALVPGRYEMSGRVRAQSLVAGRGVQWTLRCVKAGKPQSPLAASERFTGSSEWRPFAFEVVVPEGCPGQLLQLETVGIADGVVYLSGSAWFDDLMLRRLA